MSSYFSGTEAALLALNTHAYKEDLENGNKKALKVKEHILKKDYTLAILLFGNNLANILAAHISVYICLLFVGKNHPFFTISIMIGNIITSLFLLIFGEVFPKILFKQAANRFFYMFGPLLNIFKVIFKPMTEFIVLSSNFIISFFKTENHFQNNISKNDIHSIIEDSLDEGIIEEDEVFFFKQVASLSETKVVEVMRPLVDLFVLPETARANEAIKQFKNQKMKIIPVFKDRIDHISGYIDVYDLLQNTPSSKKSIHSYLKPVEYIPETTTIDMVYEVMRKDKHKIFVIVDEYGGCSGVLVEHDIIERIFGFQYKNTSHTNAMIKAIGEHQYRIDTQIDIDDINEVLSIDLPKNGYETLGGFINDIYKEIPKQGTVLYYKEMTITIDKASRRSVDLVTINLKP